MDDFDAHQDEREFRRYVRRQTGMLSAVLEVAPQVCTHQELDLIRSADWTDERLAKHYGFEASVIAGKREAAYRKIRKAIAANPELLARGERRRRLA